MAKKHIVETPITNKQDWLENRLLDVTSTEVSALYDLNPYKSANFFPTDVFPDPIYPTRNNFIKKENYVLYSYDYILIYSLTLETTCLKKQSIFR